MQTFAILSLFTAAAFAAPHVRASSDLGACAADITTLVDDSIAIAASTESIDSLDSAITKVVDDAGEVATGPCGDIIASLTQNITAEAGKFRKRQTPAEVDACAAEITALVNSAISIGGAAASVSIDKLESAISTTVEDAITVVTGPCPKAISSLFTSIAGTPGNATVAA